MAVLITFHRVAGHCGEGGHAACDEAALSRREHADKSANKFIFKINKIDFVL
jgi:hypothetical protein